MTHNLTPLYLSALVPPSVSNISRYSLRNSNDLQTIDARTTLYYNSFLPSTVRAWNNVNDEAKQSNSVNTLKCFLNKDKTRIPKHFYVHGSRKAHVLHTRLRTNCSSLSLTFLEKHFRFPFMPVWQRRECPALFFSLQVLTGSTNRTFKFTVSDALTVAPFIW